MEAGDTSRDSESANTETAELLSNEWYIRVKYEFQGNALPQLKGSLILEALENLTSLYDGIQSPLPKIISPC